MVQSIDEVAVSTLDLVEDSASSEQIGWGFVFLCDRTSVPLLCLRVRTHHICYVRSRLSVCFGVLNLDVLQATSRCLRRKGPPVT